MHTLHVDIESYSGTDLKECGLFKYVEDPAFEVLLIGYSVDGGPVNVIDCVAGDLDAEADLYDMLVSPDYIKYAYNAQFERTCLAKWADEPMPPEQWRCTMVHALTCGLPASLAAVGEALGLPADKQKDKQGKALIDYFCKPCKPTKANGGRVRNLPAHDPDKWRLFTEYNRQDVVTEMEIGKRLEQMGKVPEREQHLWELDQRINNYGIRVDVPMVEKIVEYDDQRSEELMAEAKQITGLSNPNSLAQLKGWLAKQGVSVDTLRKDDISELLQMGLTDKARRVLEIRQALGKTSTAKYSKMLDAVNADGRLRGILQFYGANRSGRWTGKLVQVHNLARNSLPDLDLAREITAAGDFDELQTLYGETSFIFSELVRTAFIPSDGHRFVVSDFSAIEARVVAWVAGEQWVLDAFKAGEDIYCKTASMMYHVPVEKHGQNAELRQKGKIAVLACIAKGTPVLTDRGLVPIESVTTDMRVWDGIDWVRHDGVIYKGKRRCISYGGLEATEDHIVWAEVDGKYQPVQFGDAARRGSRLLKPDTSRANVWLGKDNITRAEIHEKMGAGDGADAVPGLRSDQLAISGKSDAGEIKGLSELQPAESCAEVAGSEIYSSETTLRKSAGSALQRLWREGDQVRLSERDGGLSIHDRDERPAGSVDGDRQDKQRRQLCAGQSEVGDETRAVLKYTPEQDVYDIVNAGPSNRYTAAGVLVHNCGYQGGVGAMRQMDKGGTIPDEELQSVVDQWRTANPHIVKLWRSCELAAKAAIEDHKLHVIQHNISFAYRLGNIYITLPSGRSLVYFGARLKEGKYGDQIIYKGVNQTTKKWEDTETYGGKLVENIVQGIARDCLAEAMMLVDGYEMHPLQIVMHVHDEMIIDTPAESAEKVLEQVNVRMSAPIAWAPGLPLKGDGYICDFYKKD